MKLTDIEDIKIQVLPILKAAGIVRAGIFGSYVRGEQRVDSDVDFVVEYPKNTSLFDVVDLKNNLEDSLGKAVDLVGYNTIKPRLREKIMSEQMRIL